MLPLEGSGTIAAPWPTPLPGPADFPTGVKVYRRTRGDQSREDRATDAWVCTPRTITQVAAVVNWACRSGWRVRVVGSGAGLAAHAAVSGGDLRDMRDERVVLVDLTRHLDSVRVNAGPPGTRLGRRASRRHP
ncbi:FAD-binding protein [Actinocrinis sp.]|jgi:FAD/FMN-containing dehydrogenase|uniref:FAD-binding protein n=1 Tax=Actinocrinis sp. TaxID=1920516 RepID=UPI0032C24413